MVLINFTTGDCWYNCSIKFTAAMIGVNRKTVNRWRIIHEKSKIYGNWGIYFHPEEVKQKKGFAVNSHINGTSE